MAGYHRLEACRELGWTSIPAVIVEFDDLHAEIAEIDENLVRNELTALERSEQFRRRKDVYEAIHPERRPQGPAYGRSRLRALHIQLSKP